MTNSSKRRGTFSIVAQDSQNQELGIAVQSKFLAVGAVVPWVKSEVGAIATQSAANTSYGPRGLEQLRAGNSPSEVIERLTDNDEDSQLRQIGIIDTEGRTAAFTGEECFDYAGHQVGQNYSCQGNILAGEEVISAMASEFEHNDSQSLPERLISALLAGQDAGGDRRGEQSAALFVVKPEGGYGGFNDRYIDLRVDDHEQPILELERLLGLHRLYFEQPEESDLLTIEGSTARRLQRNLAELGYYDAPINGVYTEATAQALQDFALRENFEERLRDDNQIDRRIMEFMEEEKLD